MQKKLSRSKLKRWLRTASGVVILSINIIGSIDTITPNNLQHPSLIAKAMERSDKGYPRGQYIIEYEYEDEEQDDMPYEKTIFVIAQDAILESGNKMSNIAPLLSQLSDYEYVAYGYNKSDRHNTTEIYIAQPEDPLELEGLLSILKGRHTSTVAIDDNGYQKFIKPRGLDHCA